MRTTTLLSELSARVHLVLLKKIFLYRFIGYCLPVTILQTHQGCLCLPVLSLAVAVEVWGLNTKL